MKDRKSPPHTSHMSIRNVRMFAWLLVGGIFALMSCQQVPSNKLEVLPGECNIHNLLINNPAYLPHPLKLVPGAHPYANLFKKGFMYVCAVSLWEDLKPDSMTKDLRTAKDRFYSLIKMFPDGTMEALQPIDGTKSPIIQFPNYAIKNARLHMYVVPPSVGGDLVGFKKLCEEQMKLPSFNCFAPANRDFCLFYFKMIPKRTPSKASFQVQKSKNNCSLCAPEVCDGKDNDCDGKSDNIYSTTKALKRPCYTGTKKTLLDEKRGIGICAIGEQLCKGSWGACIGQQTPKSREECNNLDDNCDGVVDEGSLCSKGYICQEGKCLVTPCREDQTSCGPVCATLETDPKHCGQCNNVCPSGQLCGQGICATSCPRPTPTVCNNQSCVDLETNRYHCGKCNNKCKEGFICFAGKCTLSCPASAPQCGTGISATCCSLNCCGEQCIDLKTNPFHCGKCGKKCASGSLCFQGICRVECPSFAPICGSPGRKLCCDKKCCDDSCIDPSSDPFNCGGCGIRCKSGERCESGVCKLSCPASAPKCGPPEKESCCNLDCCNQACVDTANDQNHCGQCGNQCPSGFRCNGGQCILDCPTTAPKCGKTCCALNCCKKACVAFQNDPFNCGSCGNICPQGQVCQKGTCGYLCPSAQKLCGNFCIDISINPKHCGGCNSTCNAGERCENSSCKLCPTSAPSCGQAGQKTCCSLNCCSDSCVDTKNNPSHCGGCGKQCNSGERCNNGVCQLCPPSAPKCGSSCCSNDCCNGACVDTSYHPLHCGACGTICTGGKTCCNGQCIDLRKDKSHCGKCGSPCARKESCDQGICCSQGQSACGGKCFDLQMDKNHCGVCGNVCPQGQLCQAGKCICPNNQTKCGSICVDTVKDPKHCGACGNVCPSGQTCQNSACVCPQGQNDCGGGLCINPQTSNLHCGVCNNPCTNGRTCQSGQCLCPSGMNQCGASCVNNQTSVQNCGFCGNVCAMGSICCAGGCTNPLKDDKNCGGCGTLCAAGKTCQNGSCT